MVDTWGMKLRNAIGAGVLAAAALVPAAPAFAGRNWNAPALEAAGAYGRAECTVRINYGGYTGTSYTYVLATSTLAAMVRCQNAVTSVSSDYTFNRWITRPG